MTRSEKFTDGERHMWLFDRGMTDTEFNGIVREAQRVYAKFRCVRYPHFKVSPGLNVVDWHKTARDLVEAGASVEDWVAAQFAVYVPYPYVNQLHGVHANDNYVKYTSSPGVEESIRLQLDTSGRLYRQYRESLPDRPPADILLDEASGLTVLFRWCAAKTLELKTVVSKLAPRAAVYLAKPLYRKVYSKTFSEVMRE